MLFYRFSRLLLWLLFRVFFRIRLEGLGHVPRVGPFLLAGNHRSYIDPLILVVSLPRPLVFVTKAVRYRFPLTRRVCAASGVIALRVDRGSPGMKEAARALRSRRPVVIFPEGTRNLDSRRRPFLPGMPGVGWLAAVGRAPVVPFYLGGTDRVLPPRARIFRPGPVRLVFGRPFYYAGEPYPDFARRLMDEIARLA